MRNILYILAFFLFLITAANDTADCIDAMIELRKKLHLSKLKYDKELEDHLRRYYNLLRFSEPEDRWKYLSGSTSSTGSTWLNANGLGDERVKNAVERTDITHFACFEVSGTVGGEDFKKVNFAVRNLHYWEGD
uniref:Uncharacterized protein n=1 Tax=Caenorhabditis japonica TaxID=281687 RepID=A0A8R1IDZ2_CAEJA